jgi:hypothetical protein
MVTVENVTRRNDASFYSFGRDVKKLEYLKSEAE